MRFWTTVECGLVETERNEPGPVSIAQVLEQVMWMGEQAHEYMMHRFSSILAHHSFVTKTVKSVRSVEAYDQPIACNVYTNTKKSIKYWWWPTRWYWNWKESESTQKVGMKEVYSRASEPTETRNLREGRPCGGHDETMVISWWGLLKLIM